jgi:WD40 repeat protein
VLRAPATAFASDEAYAFVGTQAVAVDVYELAAGRPVTTYALSSDDRITALLRLPNARLVVGTGALDGRVLIVDVADAKVVHRLSPHDEAFGVTALASDVRGRLVASGSDDGRVALLDPVKGRVLAQIRVNETPLSLAFEPTGRRLACVFADGTASIVTFAQKGATVSDLGLRGATQVAWGESLVFGFKDGHTESGERHARPSDRPAVR